MEAKEESDAEAMGQQPQGGGKSSSSGRTSKVAAPGGTLGLIKAVKQER